MPSVTCSAHRPHDAPCIVGLVQEKEKMGETDTKGCGG